MSLHLISHALCPYVQRAAISLTEKGVTFERTHIDLSNKPDWFLAISPLGKTPVLVVNGTPISNLRLSSNILRIHNPTRFIRTTLSIAPATVPGLNLDLLS